MQCSNCNKLVFPLEKSSARIFVGTYEETANMALQCRKCGQILCGQCAANNVVRFEGGVVPVCPECSDFMEPCEED